MNAFGRSVLAATTLACALGGACSSFDESARVDPIGPDRATFDPVARVLVRRCGTLDCHGSVYKNLRLYGFGGLRLAQDAGVLPEPILDGGRTFDDLTLEEIDADYEAVIGLEPEKMRDVVNDKGANPERLTLIRKAHGTEEHKGTSLGKPAIDAGESADLCILSWLANVDREGAACRAVLNVSDKPKP